MPIKTASVPVVSLSTKCKHIFTIFGDDGLYVIPGYTGLYSHQTLHK